MGDFMTHKELWEFFGFLLLVVTTAVAIFIVILPQAIIN